MFGDDSKLRLRKSHAGLLSVAASASSNAKSFDCEEGLGTSDHHHNQRHHHHSNIPSSSSHSASHNNALTLPSMMDSSAPLPPPSLGHIKGRRKRRRRRMIVLKYCKLCLSGLVATVISVTLSLALLPFSWVQVDYHHQVQHEFEYVYQVLADNRRNSNTWIRGIHNNNKHEPQVTCSSGGGIGFLNDHYCDCLGDGSDEPNTSACSHVTVGQKTFQCPNHSDVWIFASRVDDGIPDCPDGSDET